MAMDIEDRTCPICEQLVKSGTSDAMGVRINPARKIYVHAGCAQVIKEAYENFMEKINVSDSKSEG